MGLSIPYSEEQKQWLLENVNSYSYEKLAPMLYERFGRKVRAESLCEYCRTKLGIDKSDKWGRKSGDPPTKEHPIGTEVIRKNAVFVKVANTGRRDDWVVKTRIVYGDVPDGQILVFLDGNPLNVTRDNLQAIEKRLHARMAQNRMFSKFPDVTKAAILWCKLNDEVRR